MLTLQIVNLDSMGVISRLVRDLLFLSALVHITKPILFGANADGCTPTMFANMLDNRCAYGITQ